MRSCSKKCITCVWVQSNKDHKALSMCGDIMYMRKNMMKEPRQIIEANPVFLGKLKYPSIKSHRLHELINQRCALREQYLSMLQRAELWRLLTIHVLVQINMFFLILDEVKSIVTDPGQSHLSAVAIPNVLPTTFALTLNEGSSPMSMDFHPTWQTLLLC
ncbi:unnamed protein product [Prunus armeniaca]